MTNSTNENNKIKILDLRDSPWVDGPGRTILDCATSLMDTPYRLVIGTFNGGLQKTNAYAEEAAKRNLPVVTIHESSAFDRQVLNQILRIIDEMDIDIVHTHDFRSNLFGLVCAKMRHKPVVSTVHGWIANDFKGKIYTMIDKILLRFFDRIITVSARTKRLVRRAWLPDNKITVITNALRVENYLPDPGDKGYRDEIGVDEDTILIGNIGRLSAEKGQLDFLQAGKEILQDFDKIRLILIGIGPDQEKLESFVSENDMTASVVFAGFRDDMVTLYNSLDLVVQSSYTEGMPNVILESLLMEVPVIATNVGGTGEIIKNGENGVLLKPELPGELAIQIRQFIDDPATYKRMAQNGRKLIIEKFSHNRRVKKLSRLYKELITAR